MRRIFSLMLAAWACLAGGAHAQVVEVPRTYPIPLPPNANPNPDPQWELGTRYWYSEGKTQFDVSAPQPSILGGSIAAPITTTHTYDDIDANALEFVWGVRNETRTFFKGFIGGGWLDGGSLGYGTMDVGQDFTLIDNRANVVISPFIGFNYWEEQVDASGLRCNSDALGELVCGPPGSIAAPFSSDIITHKAAWSSLRLGGELKAKLWDRLTLRGDAAIVPVAYLQTENTHYFRSNLVPDLNIDDGGTGWGYQLEGEIRLDVTRHWAFGAGVRYWYAETYGDRDANNLGTATKLQDFTSERFGVFGNATYRFATF